MNRRLVFAGLLFSSAVAAAGLNDFAKLWPVAATTEGAYTVTLTPDIYAQLTTRDLTDLAAFNADGEALAFGPMPASVAPPASSWREAAWFALPAELPPEAGDLSLHITRTTSGELSLDATLSHGSLDSVQAFLVDVRAKDSVVEGIAFDLGMNAPDFNARVTVEASDDLQSWRTIVSAATVAQLRHGDQSLVRRHIDLSPQETEYLRIRVLTPGQRIPLHGVRLLLRPQGLLRRHPPRQWMHAEFLRKEGRAYFYRLPAPMPVDMVNVQLGEENRLAHFSVSARQENARHWGYVGQMTAFRLRGAGVSIDNEPMEVGSNRLPEWRIESSVDLAKTPVLDFAYYPETWMLLTHGRAPYAIAAGSSWARRDSFPLELLLNQVRDKLGEDWRPAATELGASQPAGGPAALKAYNRDQIKSWVLWGVLILAACIIVWMVLRLLRAPPPAAE